MQKNDLLIGMIQAWEGMQGRIIYVTDKYMLYVTDLCLYTHVDKWKWIVALVTYRYIMKI